MSLFWSLPTAMGSIVHSTRVMHVGHLLYGLTAERYPLKLHPRELTVHTATMAIRDLIDLHIAQRQDISVKAEGACKICAALRREAPPSREATFHVSKTTNRNVLEARYYARSVVLPQQNWKS